MELQNKIKLETIRNNQEQHKVSVDSPPDGLSPEQSPERKPSFGVKSKHRMDKQPHLD